LVQTKIDFASAPDIKIDLSKKAKKFFHILYKYVNRQEKELNV